MDQETKEENDQMFSFKQIASFSQSPWYKQNEENKQNKENIVLHALITLCDFLYHYNSKQKEWKNKLSCIWFGAVKKTTNYGTTSVTQGIANQQFDEDGELKQLHFLNCGTNTIKYQVFSSENCYHMEEEIKSHISFNQTLIGPYIPSKIDLQFFNKLIDFKKQILKSVIHNQECQFDSNMRLIKITIQLFITGSIRDFYYADTTNETMRMNMNMEVTNIVRSHLNDDNIEFVPLQNSWFLSKEQESKSKIIASECVYQNLYKFGVLDEEINVLGSWRMNQITLFPGYTITINDTNLDTFESTLIQEFQKIIPILEERLEQFNPDKKLIWELKSGFNFYFQDLKNKHASLYNFLQTNQMIADQMMDAMISEINDCLFHRDLKYSNGMLLVQAIFLLFLVKFVL